jgi:hypothetical protein
LDIKIHLNNTQLQNRLLIVYFIVTMGTLFIFASHWVYDDPFITYRYADNLRQGLGFVYNPGQHILSTTTPLFALILAGGSFFWPDVRLIASLISVASLAAGAIFLYKLADCFHTPWVKLTALLLYPAFPLLNLTISSETPLYLALILGTFLYYQRRSYLWTALLAALVVLTRPDGALLPVLLAVHFLLVIRQPVPWKAILLFILINLAWFGFAWVYFGSPLPVTLMAKQQQGIMTISQRFLPGFLTVIKGYTGNLGYLLAGVLVLPGAAAIIFRHAYRQWLLLILWTLVYFIAYSVLGVTRYFWYYAPLVPAFIVLVGLGINQIWDLRKKFNGAFMPAIAAGAAICCFAFLGFTHWRSLWQFRVYEDKRIPAYFQVGNWLRYNTPEGASVGAVEVGAIGYYSHRPMVDFAGLIQPDVARQLSRDTTYEDAAIYAAENYHPDYMVLTNELFPRLRDGYVARYCQNLHSIQEGQVVIDIFACAQP